VRRSILLAVTLALAASLAAGADPAPDRGPAAEGDQAAAGSLLERVRRNRQRLMRSATQAPPASEPSVDLEEAARRLREAVRRPLVKPEPVEEVKPAPGEGTAAGPKPPVAPAPQKPLLSPAGLRRIRELSLEDLGDPLALADTLFLGEHLEAAGALYERLLAEASLSDADRAWCLFQAAGCKGRTDPAGALALYDRLLAEHPDSLWAEAAKVRQTILQWRRQARPQALLGSAKTTEPKPTPAEPKPTPEEAAP